MKRSIVINNSNSSKQQRKRSLDDLSSMTKLKKRRHSSPQRDHNRISENKKLKKDSTSRTKKNSPKSRRSLSTEHLNEITLPNWERISPNIDQILSNKHTQSGVYAHEVHLVQQELEALLSMAIVRENLLNNILHSKKSLNNDNIRSKILQHQQAESVYSSKKIPSQPLPPLFNPQHQQLRHNNPHLLLDRQVSVTPVIGARIDKIWSDINTFYHKISSNDILTIENLVKFNEDLEEKIQQYKTEYKNNILTQSNIIEQLNEENYQNLINIVQINPLITHYIERTAIGRFQTRLYEQVPHTSPVYKTPISSPFYRKSLGNYNSSLRISSRLRSNHRLDLFSNLKPDDDPDQSSLLKSTKKTRIASLSPPSSINIQERIQLVHDYLTDQHPLGNERTKGYLSNEIKSTRRRKTSISIPNDHCTDIFESKLSTLITLLHECSSLSLCALKRARLQSNNEQIWQKLNTIENELDTLVQKLDTTGGFNNNSTNTDKTFQTLDHLLKDWEKYEDDFDQLLYNDND